MVSIRDNGQNYQVLWRSDEITRLDRHGIEPVEQITCAILGNDLKLQATGRALRSAKDTPNDLQGMELSLGRALQQLTSRKELRAKFWDAFNHSAGTVAMSQVLGEVYDSEELPSLSQMNHGQRVMEIRQALAQDFCADADCTLCELSRNELQAELATLTGA